MKRLLLLVLALCGVPAIVSAAKAPTAPTNLGATAQSSSSIALAWTDNAATETGETMQRCQGASCTNFQTIATLAARTITYLDSSLTAATTYRYRVRAFNGSSVSKWSSIRNATTFADPTPAPPSPPLVPSSLSCNAVSSIAINIAWVVNATTDTSETLQRCAGVGCANFAQIASLPAGTAAYSDTGLVANTSYTYRTASVNQTLISTWSNTDTCSTTNPAAPSSLSGTPNGSTEIDLTWTVNAVRETSETLQRCTGVSCSGFATIATLTAGTASYKDTGLTAATSYSYRVASVDSLATSAYSNTGTAVTSSGPAPPSPPLAPSSLTANAISDTRIDLAWTVNAVTDTSETVQRCAGSGCSTFVTIANLAAGTASYSNTGLTQNTSYSYQVASVNAGTSSAYSNTAAASTQATPPPNAPSALSGNAVSSTEIDLTWTDNASNETSQTLQRCSGSGCSNFLTIATIAANAVAYVDAGLTASTSYSYRIAAISGLLQSAWSNTATATTQSGTPPPPVVVYGPTSTITCPAGSTLLTSGQNIASIISGGAQNASFCLAAGTYNLTTAINVRAGQTITGTYGAILDGTGIPAGDGSTSIIRGWTCDSSRPCQGVTIRNLTIRNITTQNCIGTYGNQIGSTFNSNWTIDHNAISGCPYGIAYGNLSALRVTNNALSGACPLGGAQSTALAVDHNHFTAASDHNCKFIDNYATGYASNVQVTNNVYDSYGDDVSAIWFDTLGTGNVIDGNTIQGATSAPAIFNEATTGSIIRNNTITTASDGTHGIFLSKSANAQVLNNTIIATVGGGVQLFTDAGFTQFTVGNDTITGNSVTLNGTTTPIIISCAGYSASQCLSYFTTHGSYFNTNAYSVGSLSGTYWSTDNGLLTFTQWQAAGQDVNGSIAVH